MPLAVRFHFLQSCPVQNGGMSLARGQILHTQKQIVTNEERKHRVITSCLYCACLYRTG